MLIHELEQQGGWLFRHRSYIPLALLPFALLVLASHREPWTDVLWLERGYELGCLLISLCGLMVRGMALGYAQPGSSGRNTKEQIADHLNITGLYSVCRHPLYVGNILMMLGVLLFTKSALLALAGFFGYILFYERIIAAEERFLADKFGAVFQEWAVRTPALFPRSRQWLKPSYSFKWRAAVKGEFYGFTALVSSLFALRSLDIRFIEGAWRLDMFWFWPFAASLLLFVILRFLRKHTTLFEEPRAPEDM
ncbi:lipid A phosphate methyltransferase [candidate division KSB1 bacterium]|nr:MAG: lipid A phosphate methyltransferase [candidate division KSB1 bacterium]